MKESELNKILTRHQKRMKEFKQAFDSVETTRVSKLQSLREKAETLS